MKLVGIITFKKTYGKHKNGKHLYKCTTADGIFYVPYSIQYSFNKAYYDLYVVIDTETSTIHNTIGPVNSLENMCDYELKKNNLIAKPYYLDNLEIHYLDDLKLQEQVFTIDSPDTIDFDDGFSIHDRGITVYISNVAYILNKINYWDKLTDQITSIYLPYKKIDMLGEKIRSAASLKKNKWTPVMCCKFIIGESVKIEFSEGVINPYENYTYDSETLLYDNNYKRLIEWVNKIKEKNQSIEYVDESPSFIVEYLMRFTCFSAGNELCKKKLGIFRTIHKPLEDFYPSNKYVDENNINTEPYSHITSPIRRLVDILNQYMLMYYNTNTNADHICEKWMAHLHIINEKNKHIKKLQNISKLLSLDIFSNSKPTIYEGKILEEAQDMDGVGLYKYAVFIKSLVLLVYVTSIKKYNGNVKIQLFKFEKENNLRKKIKAVIVD